MTVKETNPTPKKQSPLHAFLSLIVPGLGQFVAKQPIRGISFLATVLALGNLSIWTISQRARFPDFSISARVYIPLVLQSAALLVFLIALRYLANRYLIKDAVGQSFTGVIMGIIYILVIVFSMDTFLQFAGTAEDRKMVFEATGMLSAAALAAFWIWQAADAGRLGAITKEESLPSTGLGILIACLLVFSLGYNITQINLPKAIQEYKDTGKLLSQIGWPWRNAFEYEQVTVEVTQKIQAPCPEGATGPASNPPLEGEPWVSVTPTCGEITERDLQGNVTPGTELTITGGGFTPGDTVQILWRNPIGNAFTPRGVGDTDILIDENGEFETTMNIPEVVIASNTAVGDLIHTLVIRKESAEVFTGRLSEDMVLALIGILETIMIALMATFFGILLAFPFSFLAARNLMAPIIQPLGEVTGSVIGLIGGIWGAVLIDQQIAILLGGLDKAPIQVFLSSFVVLLILGGLGIQVGSRLYKWATNNLGDVGALVLNIVSIIPVTAVVGYFLGISYSKGIRMIALGPEVAAVNETLYGYIGAGIVGLLGLTFALRIKPKGEVKVGMVLYGITRTLMNIIRSIEPIIYAIIATIWVGLGPFAGTIALTLHTIAALGELYSESIESIEPGPIEALQATGANRLQTIIYAVVPQILPPFISYTIYRWDVNVRMSTIIGAVGGGGIGFILIQWIRIFNYRSAGLAVWLIAITVATLDYVSSNIRERFV